MERLQFRWHDCGFEVESNDRGTLHCVRELLAPLEGWGDAAHVYRFCFRFGPGPAERGPGGEPDDQFPFAHRGDKPMVALRYGDLVTARLSRGARLRLDLKDGFVDVRRPEPPQGPDLERFVELALLAPLNVLLRERGRYFMHAGCVVDETGGAALLAGASGAGKSTTTIGLALGGLALASDDLTLLEPRAESGAFAVRGFPKASGLSEHTFDMFRDVLDPQALVGRRGGTGKELIYLGRALNVEQSPGGHLALILLPQLTHTDSAVSFRRLSPAQAFDALAHSGLGPAGRSVTEGHFATVSRLAEEIPAYTAAVGTDQTGLVKGVRSLLKTHRSPSAGL